MALIDDCRKALRVTTTAYDSEIQLYIDAARDDLRTNGVVIPSLDDALVNKAVLTYVRMSFGSPKDYDKLKDSYDGQKATLKNASGYTNWGTD